MPVCLMKRTTFHCDLLRMCRLCAGDECRLARGAGRAASGYPGDRGRLPGSGAGWTREFSGICGREHAGARPDVRPQRRQLAHGVEHRPRPARLPLERLREADQVAARCRCRARPCRRSRTCRRDRSGCAARSGGCPRVRAGRCRRTAGRRRSCDRVGRRHPAAHQHAHQPPGDDLDADRHLVDLLALHPPHDRRASTARLP